MNEQMEHDNGEAAEDGIWAEKKMRLIRELKIRREERADEEKKGIKTAKKRTRRTIRG